MKLRILLNVEGGVVQGVITNGECDVHIMDHDVVAIGGPRQPSQPFVLTVANDKFTELLAEAAATPQPS